MGGGDARPGGGGHWGTHARYPALPALGCCSKLFIGISCPAMAVGTAIPRSPHQQPVKFAHRRDDILIVILFNHRVEGSRSRRSRTDRQAHPAAGNVWCGCGVGVVWCGCGVGVRPDDHAAAGIESPPPLRLLSKALVDFTMHDGLKQNHHFTSQVRFIETALARRPRGASKTPQAARSASVRA